MFLVELLLIGILLFPLIALTLFIVSLVNFLLTPKDDVEKRKASRSTLIIWSIVMGVSIAMLVALIAFFATAVSFM